MKRSESDGTDLKINKKMTVTLLLILFYLTPAVATELHLFTTVESNVLNGVVISGKQSYHVTSVINNDLIEGVILNPTTDSVNDGTGGLDSVNDGTGGLDSVNDGTGGLDSVNDGTGGLDSVNDGTGGLENFDQAIVSIDLLDCQTLKVETSINTFEFQLSSISIDNKGVKCN